MVLPGDPDSDAARTPWNVAVPQNPLAVVEVADAEDVRRAVRWAIDHQRQITAQPVGHGAGDSLDGVLLLRTRALNSIEIDLAAGTARLAPGSSRASCWPRSPARVSPSSLGAVPIRPSSA